jgi:hypothetical protein
MGGSESGDVRRSGFDAVTEAALMAKWHEEKE